eukprot:126608-Pleurochrysis_carterae.AAC.1
MRRHDATAWMLGRWSVLAGVARAAALLNESGDGALASRLMLSATKRATWGMRREGGAVVARRASDGKRLVQRVKPAADVARGGATRGKVRASWCVTGSCASRSVDTVKHTMRSA